MPTHSQVATATDSALQIERAVNYTQVGAKQRYDWVTEAELSSRFRQGLLVAAQVAPEWCRLNAQGRKAAGATNHDVEIGLPLTCAIEVVYCWAAAAPSPAKPLDGDLGWMLGGRDRHVVAFLPRMRPGYRVQNHPTPYDLNGASIATSLVEFFLCDCLQVGGLGANALALCSGIFDIVPKPAAGASKRWSLSASIAQQSKMPVAGCTVQRTVTGSPNDHMWSITWSTA